MPKQWADVMTWNNPVERAKEYPDRRIALIQALTKIGQHRPD
jgi:hypothetical protein